MRTYENELFSNRSVVVYRKLLPYRSVSCCWYCFYHFQCADSVDCWNRKAPNTTFYHFSLHDYWESLLVSYCASSWLGPLSLRCSTPLIWTSSSWRCRHPTSFLLKNSNLVRIWNQYLKVLLSKARPPSGTLYLALRKRKSMETPNPTKPWNDSFPSPPNLSASTNVVCTFIQFSKFQCVIYQGH